ncbi:hypothetical protein L202_04372 [Cryptococcus amylolentus CBS 6039]|uniref:Uncharacterized protein n=2 Tax=Cryptococcus amylolentus TaxID=104669 RepID=A0A1E3HT18_9TREE|nr:hypothetical protein L202_04372 [Cryptococcus amylolentus CBS 6039]ODN78826.1 hypothetical protein L202_04372 [Cryptococcus amylolentus CBS 6039]ODO06689.1 hypothetical protein I350_04047 [Cryptococcus amylolentus CBS 6273]
MTDVPRGRIPPANNDTPPANNDERRTDDGFEEVAASPTVSAQGTSIAASIVVGDDAEAYEFVNSPTSHANSSMGSFQPESHLEQPEEENTVEIEYDSPKEQPNIRRKRKPTSGNRIPDSFHNTFIDMQSFDQATQINRDVNPNTDTHRSVSIGSRAYDNSLMISGDTTQEDIITLMSVHFERLRRGEN